MVNEIKIPIDKDECPMKENDEEVEKWLRGRFFFRAPCNIFSYAAIFVPHRVGNGGRPVETTLRWGVLFGRNIGRVRRRRVG